jgi:hypothetical protein
MHEVFLYFVHVNFEIHAMQQMFEHSAHWASINLIAKYLNNNSSKIINLNIKYSPGFLFNKNSDSIPVIFETVVNTCAHDAAARSIQ